MEGVNAMKDVKRYTSVDSVDNIYIRNSSEFANDIKLAQQKQRVYHWHKNVARTIVIIDEITNLLQLKYKIILYRIQICKNKTERQIVISYRVNSANLKNIIRLIKGIIMLMKIELVLFQFY